MRRPHTLSAVLGNSMPQELIVFDTETAEHLVDDSTIEHRLVFGWALYSRVTNAGNFGEPQWFRFTDGFALWQWVEDHCREKKTLYTFCHNANFDWQVTSMCQVLPMNGWCCEKAVIEDPPNWFVWRRDLRRIDCLDSTNFWPQPLREIGERIGLRKYDMPINWSDVVQSDEYCKRDCEIVYYALLDWFAWLTTNRLGNFAISKAGQAMVAYRHRFMDHEICIHSNEKALKLERAAYMGGRTEVWTLGRPVADIVGVDVNSMYLYVMRANRYPNKLVGIYVSPSKTEILDWIERYCIVARCWLRCDLPIYPLRTRYGIVFPVGQFATTLTTPEIICAVERNHLAGVTVAAVYESAPVFTRFVDELYNLRLQFARAHDETGKYNTKIMSVSLYGKFGQRGGYEQVIGYTDDLSLRVEDEYDLETGKRYRIRYIAGVITARSLDEESRDSFPAIAAHVTAYGRQYLWSLAEQCGLDHVHYMDTDSLHIDKHVLDAIGGNIDSERLGALKIEKHISRAVYYGPKDYELDAVSKTKGIRASALKIGEATYEQDQWVSLRGSMARGHTGGPLVIRVQKTLRREYMKGEVSASGRVQPFRLDWQP